MEIIETIRRNVYVRSERLVEPIVYTQGTDAIPIEFYFRDVTVPKEATVRVMIEKPSKKMIYNEIKNSIRENVITVKPEKQMVAETGVSYLQIEILVGEDSLYTHLQPVLVRKSIIPISSKNGSNFIDEYLRKMQECIDRMEEAREEIIEMAERGDFSASVDVGDTATLEPGEPATVKNVGTIRDAVLNFGIPKGKTGATGPRGPQGVQGIQGPPGEDGEDGGNGIVTELGPGLFGIYVNEGGHLIMVATQGEETPTLKIVDGRLKYIIGEAGA